VRAKREEENRRNAARRRCSMGALTGVPRGSVSGGKKRAPLAESASHRRRFPVLLDRSLSARRYSTLQRQAAPYALGGAGVVPL
jgi:hypothetical protein